MKGNLAKGIRVGVFIFLIVAVILIGWFNVCILQNTDFWNCSISTCFSILVALVVSYLYTKRNQDERNQKEAFRRALEKAQDLVNDEALYKFKEDKDIKRVLMKKRALNNVVGLLQKYASKYRISKEIEEIKKYLDEYCDLLGNHTDDLNHLIDSEPDLMRPLLLIDGKLSEAMIAIFE